MNPYLTSEKHPRIKVKVSLSSSEQIDCLIDTGFSGGISLPESLKPTEKIVGYQEYELADGSRVVFDLYEAKVTYNGVSKLVTAIFSKSEDALIGIEFLEGFRFILDLKLFKTSLE